MAMTLRLMMSDTLSAVELVDERIDDDATADAGLDDDGGISTLVSRTGSVSDFDEATDDAEAWSVSTGTGASLTTVRDAAEQGARDTAMSLRPHDDEVRFPALGDTEDLLERGPLGDERVELLPARPRARRRVVRRLLGGPVELLRRQIDPDRVGKDRRLVDVEQGHLRVEQRRQVYRIVHRALSWLAEVGRNEDVADRVHRILLRQTPATFGPRFGRRGTPASRRRRWQGVRAGAACAPGIEPAEDHPSGAPLAGSEA
jgi:hypothetical protein